MSIYWIIFTTLSISSGISIAQRNVNLNFILFLSSFVLLLVFIGLRDQTGSDWNYYLDFYNSLGGFEVENNFEIGYYLFSKTFSLWGLDYKIYLFLCTLIYLVIFFYVFFKNKYSSLLVVLFYSSNLLALMGQARQVLAVALCVLAGQFLLNGKKKYFIAMVLFASIFHKSALIFLLAYFSPIYKYKNIHLALLVSIAFFFEMISIDFNKSAVYISNYFPVIASQLIAYISSPENSPIFFVEDPVIKILLFAKRILFGLLFIYCTKFIERFKNEYTFYLNNYLISLIIFLFLYGAFPAIAVRLSLYFYIYDIFLISLIVINSTAKYRHLFFFAVLLICSQRLATPLYNDADYLIPYKGIFFINESVVKDMPR